MRKPNFTLISNFKPFVFVVPPADLRVENAQNHKPINIIDVGEIIRNGTPNAVRISFSGFFPSANSQFYDATLNPLPALACVEYLKMEAEKNTVFSFMILEWGTFLKCKIENLQEIYNDHTGDIYYQISLVEEKSTTSSVKNMITGLLGRS